MNRIDFIRGTISMFGLSVLPSDAYVNYHRIHLLQSFVRGFQYYRGPKILHQMKSGALIEMLREPDNIVDGNAIALYFNKDKIGFVPAERNLVLSRLMDADLLKLQAEITHLEPKAKTWENVAIVVYALRESDEPLPKNATYLTLLETPEYYSLKIAANQVIQMPLPQHTYIPIEQDAEVLFEHLEKRIDLISAKLETPLSPRRTVKKFESKKEFVKAAKDMKFVIKKPENELKYSELLRQGTPPEFELIPLKTDDNLTLYKVRYKEDSSQNAHFGAENIRKINQEMDAFFEEFAPKVEEALREKRAHFNENEALKTVVENHPESRASVTEIEDYVSHFGDGIGEEIEEGFQKLAEKLTQLNRGMDRTVENNFQKLSDKLSQINHIIDVNSDVEAPLERIHQQAVKAQLKFVDILTQNQYQMDHIFDPLFQTIEGKIIDLEHVFDEKGYFAANLSNIINYEDKVIGFVEKIDRSGDIFYEIMMAL